MRFRPATTDDIDAIATLHADSWRRHYRGALADAFLDGEVVADRQAVWGDRLTRPRPDHQTVVADDGGRVAGFSYVMLDDDPTWGALVDNLHVTYDLKGQGIGTGLMAATAAVVVERRPGSGLYLWVLEQNVAAQAFYQARGGTLAGRELDRPPGGGTVVGLRYVWPDPSTLVSGLGIL
jgi:ribosomal protein S18 acetylase RimI-like enzyme